MSRRKRGVAVGAVLAAAVGVAALLFLRSNGDGAADPSGVSALRTASVQQRDLAEYLEISGTLDYADSLTLTSQSSGVLLHLAPEGTVVRRGEPVYQAIDEPTEAETADVLARLASARNSLVAAQDELSDAVSGPSEADVAAARAALADAREARDDLLEPPSEAEIVSAEAAVETASEALDTLLDPSAADLAEARSRLSSARSDLDDLLAGASQAEIESARAALLTAESDLDDLRAGASRAEIESARAAVILAEEDVNDYIGYADSHPTVISLKAALAVARQDLADLLAGASEAQLDAAEAAVLAADEALADLLAGASEAQLDAAEAAVLAAREALDDLLAGGAEADLDAAEATVQAAAETVETLENPTEGARLSARADLAAAQEALDDLLAGPAAAEIDRLEADILAAQEALDDLLAGASAADIEALEASVASAEAAVVSAEADLAELGAGLGSRVVMYGSTPAYRTMAVGLSGDDVRQLEQNLAALGHGFSAVIVVDDVFDEATAEAVRRWQEAAGHEPDGTVGMSDIVFTTGPVQVGSWAQGVELGQDVAPGTALATLTVIQAPADGEMVTTQQVTADLPLSDRDLVSEGVTVNVELPDNTDIAGTVTAISPFPSLDADAGESAVEVTILLAEPASEVWIGATVDVEITETLVEDALVVPATALLALVEGGYAVEVVDADGATRLVGVETGLFVDGDVEVRSGQLSAGMPVVVPR